MNVNPAEWSQAQDLLIKLVQALTPWTDRPIPTSVFSKLRFTPPIESERSSLQLRHPVRLLTMLYSVQRQVEQFIAKMPFSQEPKPRDPEPAEKQKLPLSKQAKQLITQVQEAIGKLSNSTVLKNREEAPLREALKNLKPSLDRIIETVIQESPSSQSSSLPRVFLPANRFFLPKSERQELIKKHLERQIQPQKQIPTSSLKPEALPSLVQREERGDLPEPAATSFRKVRAPKKESSRKEIPDRPPLSRSAPETSKSSLSSLESNPKREGEREVFRTPEKTVIPGAPFIFDTKTPSFDRKKKKRKGFWFREEEEDRDNP